MQMAQSLQKYKGSRKYFQPIIAQFLGGKQPLILQNKDMASTNM